MDNYYISFVVATRNDNHGGNMIKKNQIFIENLSQKLTKYKLDAEIIVVEWNPDLKRQRLQELLKNSNFSKNKNQIKIITVPKKEHLRFKNSKKINLFQMIAKNVGIRKSNAQYILCTNMDIIFSNEMISYLAKKNLKPNILYRADRYDVKLKEFNNKQLDEKNLNKKVFLINKKNYSYHLKKKKYFYTNTTFKYFISYIFKIIKKRKFNILKLKKKSWIFRLKEIQELISKITFGKKLHTNASGDFIILDKKSWFKLKGFYEFQGYSWHLDSLFMWNALKNKIKFKNLKQKIYHLDQQLGSGFDVGSNKLFKKLKKKKIDFIDDSMLKKFITNNHINSKYWGLSKVKLKTKILNPKN